MRKQANNTRPSWLIVSYYANVDGRAASHHIDDRLAAFRAAGIDITVISSTLGPLYKQEKHLRVFSLMPSAILEELKAGLKRNKQYSKLVHIARLALQIFAAIPLLLLSIFERLFLHRDKRWSWQFTAALRGWFWCKRQRPDLILSTGGPASAHVAGKWLSAKLDVPLVCEFQDPLPYQYPPSNKPIHDYHLKLEAELAGSAAALVYLTDGAVDAAKTRFNSAQGQPAHAVVFAVLSGAPENSMPAKVAQEQRVFAHIGTLSGSRNLDAVLQALSAMALEDDKLPARFLIQLAGTVGKDVMRSIEAFHLNRQIECLGRQPRGALDAVVASADILLLVQNTGAIAKETIPSKAFEYLQTGRPILALIDGNAQLQTLLQEHGHVVYDFNDDITVLQERLSTLLTAPLPEIQPCRYTVQYSVDELVAQIELALKRKME